MRSLAITVLLTLFPLIPTGQQIQTTDPKAGPITTIITEPSGANVIIDGQPGPKTPARFVLLKKNGAERILLIKLHGYKTIEQRIVPKEDPITIRLEMQKDDSLATAPEPSPASTSTSGIQPYEIKGEPLGMRFEEWRQKHPTECDDSFTPSQQVATVKNQDFICANLKASYAGIRATEMTTFFNQQMVSIYFQVHSDNYSSLRDALKQKFGNPSSMETKTYQNQYGATSTGEYLHWDNGVSAITLEEIADKDHSGLLFLHKSIAAELLKAKNKINKNDM